MDSIIKLILGIAAVLLIAIGLIACQSKKQLTEPQTSENIEPSIFSSSKSSAGKYQRISAKDAQARMDSGDEIIILDVRTPAEFAEGYIKGAINLPLDRITKDAPTVLTDKEAEILIYCRSGNRSKTAAQQLIKLGYTNVYDFGGIIDWSGEVVTD